MLHPRVSVNAGLSRLKKPSAFEMQSMSRDRVKKRSRSASARRWRTRLRPEVSDSQASRVVMAMKSPMPRRPMPSRTGASPANHGRPQRTTAQDRAVAARPARIPP